MRATILRLHEAGVAHLDLHWDNVCVVFVEGGLRAQIIDFGLAEFATNNSHFDEFKQKDIDFVEDLADDSRLFLSSVVFHEGLRKEEPQSRDETEGEQSARKVLEDEEDEGNLLPVSPPPPPVKASPGAVSEQRAGITRRRSAADARDPMPRKAAKWRRRSW